MKRLSELDKLPNDNLNNTLVEQLESMEMLCDVLKAGLWIIRFNDKGEMLSVEWEDSFRKLLGYITEEELPNDMDAWEGLIHPDDKDWVMQYYWGFVDGYSDSETYDIEYRIKTKTLGWHWVREIGKLVRSDNDLPIVFRGAIIDIDEQKRLQDKMVTISRKNTENFGMINGLSREFHVVMLLKGNDRKLYPYRIEENSTFTKAYQQAINAVDFDTAIRDYAMIYIHPDDRERVLREASFEAIRSNTSENDNYTIDYRRLSSPDAFTYHQVVFARAYTTDGQENYVLGFRDVDEIIQKQRLLSDALEAARHASNAKTIFLNNVSHDVRTPMNGIIGYASLALSKYNDSEAIRDYLSKILISSNHLLSLINDVLDMSRIESGTIKIQYQAANLEELLDDIKTMVQADVLSKKIDFRIDKTNLFSKNVLCDKLRLNQVFLNLVGNAIKFTPKNGRVEIFVKQYNTSSPEKAGYEFKFRDNGIGMSEEFLKRIFNPFEREERDTVVKTQGTGLGMAITKNIVDLMGGSIEVDSELNKGTEFTVRLEMSLAEESLQADTPLEVGTGNLDFTGSRALLAEDNEINQEIAIALLEQIGFEVDVADNGAIAVEMLQEADDYYYDIVLMDIQMPVQNGYETAIQIRAMDNRVKSALPIIAMTANAFEEDKKRAMDVGMNSHIAKPFNPEDLYTVIARFIHKRS